MIHFRKKLINKILQIPGWHTKRKIVVIESDDWGSIRMPSREVYETLLKKGIRVDLLSYNRYDALESEDDLIALFQVLSSIRDVNGNSAVITSNTVVANPDFEKIFASDYKEYFYEPFTVTLSRYPRHTNSYRIWKQGIEAGIFQPQFHGREHLNVKRWMRALQENIGYVRFAFENHMYDLSTSMTIGENSFMETLNYEDIAEIEYQKKALSEGLDLFENIFGYRSSTFIPPCYIWSNMLNQHLSNNGIKGFQGGWFQYEPIPGREHRFKKRFHYTGQRNKAGQFYLIRNAFFEPSSDNKFDWKGEILSRMNLLFSLRKPTIISTHRVNFIGFIDKSNRDRNLRLLSDLLHKIVEIYPDVEFMSSDKLLNLIISGNG